MKHILILLLLVLCNCAPPIINSPTDVKPYVNDFIHLVGVNQVSTGTIVHQKISDDYYAVCESGGMEPWVIRLNTTYWSELDDVNKESVVFHELTHCLYDSEKHSDADGSYMSEYHSFDGTKLDLFKQVVDYVKTL